MRHVREPSRVIFLLRCKKDSYLNLFLIIKQFSVKIIAMNKFHFVKSPEEVSKGIVVRMKSRRKEKKITQAMLAQYSAVSLGSIKRFERSGEISLSSLIKIALALGCEDDFDSLFSEKDCSSVKEVIDENE